ncbi:hypothetical protein ABXN37_05660 [Piscinibacter sakaiensis]|uniref:hypothetical protein n=1 Tax=Piscinibacter sakaiensis TaxID=1547922 RepID=UPI00372A1CF3
MELQVAMGHAGLVHRRQAFQQLADPADVVERAAAGVRLQPLAERGAVGAVDGDIGPVVLHADLAGRRHLRVLQPRGEVDLAAPVGQRGLVQRLAARQREHHVLLDARVVGQPGHAALALAEQPAQLEAAERPGRGARGGAFGRARGGRRRGRQGHCEIGSQRGPTQRREQRGDHRALPRRHAGRRTAGGYRGHRLRASLGGNGARVDVSKFTTFSEGLP